MKQTFHFCNGSFIARLHPSPIGCRLARGIISLKKLLRTLKIMVTTRSGKPLSSNAKGTGLKVRLKPAAAIYIFEEPIATESKKRESPCKIGASELK